MSAARDADTPLKAPLIALASCAELETVPKDSLTFIKPINSFA